MKTYIRLAAILLLLVPQLAGRPGTAQAAAAQASTDAQAVDASGSPGSNANGSPAAGASGSAAAAALPAAPTFSEKDIFGRNMIALRSYLGKVVVLNFWATWCPPCREEIPALETLQSSHGGRVAVIGVSVFCSEFDTEKFYKDFRINYPVFYGSFDLMEKYGKVSAVPTTFIINKKGEIAATIVGARTRDQYEEMIRPLLAP